MNRIIDEQLSALFDGELPAAQESLLLRRLEREPESREKLARFGLIGELVRDASAQTSALSISERVSVAIASEETISPLDAPTASSSSVGFVGAGIAASIALLVMFNLTDRGNTPYISSIEVPAQSELVASNDAMAMDSARLTRYLVSHAQYSNSPSRQLADSHIAMAVVTPEIWTRHE